MQNKQNLIASTGSPETKDHLFSISEVFSSLEGEGPYTGYPTSYIRFSKCNLKCPGFNNYDHKENKVQKITEDGYAELGFNIDGYEDIKDMPIITRGCDSQYSVNPDFVSFWKELTVDQLIHELKKTTPGNSFVMPSGKSWSVSLTGGEPMLNWKHFDKLLFHPEMKDIHHYIMETNGTVPVTAAFANTIKEWMDLDERNTWTWACSPKLSNSGHTFKERIKPKAILGQQKLAQEHPLQSNGYLKFVCSNKEETFKEIQEVLKCLQEEGLSKEYNVLIMPEACLKEQQDAIAREVAELCMQYGFNFCYRLHNTLWGNTVGV